MSINKIKESRTLSIKNYNEVIASYEDEIKTIRAVKEELVNSFTEFALFSVGDICLMGDNEIVKIVKPPIAYEQNNSSPSLKYEIAYGHSFNYSKTVWEREMVLLLKSKKD